MPPVLQALHDPMEELAVSGGNAVLLCCAVLAAADVLCCCWAALPACAVGGSWPGRSSQELPALQVPSCPTPVSLPLRPFAHRRRWRPSAAPRAAPTAAAWATASLTAPSCGQTARSRRASSRTGLAAAAAALEPRCSAAAGPVSSQGPCQPSFPRALFALLQFVSACFELLAPSLLLASRSLLARRTHHRSLVLIIAFFITS